MSPTRHQKTTKGCCWQAGRAVVRACGAVRGRCARALGQRTGFTITEALTTVIIVGLVTTILAGGIGLATKQYTQQMVASEAQMLYSSLQKILDTELRFVENFTCDASGNVTDFESKHYMAQGQGSDPSSMKATTKLSTITRLPGDVMIPREPSNPGQLAMATGYDNGKGDELYNLLLPSAAYNYGLQASVKTFTYNSAGNYFRVHLVISRPSGETAGDQILADETFTVRALNFSATSTSGGSSVGSTGSEGSTGGSSGTGGGGNTGGSEGGTGGIFKVTVGDTVKFQTEPIDCKDNKAPQDIQVGSVISRGDGIFYVANKPITKGDNLEGAESGGGNSAILIPVLMDGDNNPLVIGYKDIGNNTSIEIGTLCIGEDNQLYIYAHETGNDKAPPKGGWLLVDVPYKG